MPLLRRLFLFAAIVCVLHVVTGCGEDHRNLPELSVDHVYVYGEKISFAAGGDSHRFRTTGWSNPEASGVWTDGPAATLVFRVPPPSGPLRLSARLSPNIRPPSLDAQLVSVYVRGKNIATWRVTGPGEFTALIPQQLVSRDLPLAVDLHIPGAVSPQELGTGSDTRRLGVQCSEISIAVTDFRPARSGYSLGTVIKFGDGRGAERYQVSGWSKPEAEFTWTEGMSAALQLPLRRSERRLVLRARMRGISRSAEMPFQPTDVYVNGQSVAHWEVGAPAEFQTPIPPELTNQTDSLFIEIRTPMAVSPSSLGANDDKRVLGVCVFELQVTES